MLYTAPELNFAAVRRLGAAGLALAALALLVGCGGSDSAPVAEGRAGPLSAALATDTIAPPSATSVTTLASGLVNPWSPAFMPDGRRLVTEKPGRLRIVSASGALSAPLGGVPQVDAAGQGGLLEVAVALWPPQCAGRGASPCDG